jgi:hypothetical protein
LREKIKNKTMKNSIKTILIICLATSLIACKKSTTTNTDVVYEETLNNVLKQEPILLSFGNETANKRVTWTSTPSTGVTISSVNNNATITFTNAGSYIVQANNNGMLAKYYITVKEELYNDYGTGFNIIAPKFYGIKPNEPLVFKAVNVAAATQLSANVYAPNGYSFKIDNTNKTVTVSFASAGFGEVNISNGTTNIRRTVWVDDVNNPTPNKENVGFILNDKLMLTPEVIVENGITYLQIKTSTTKNYHCNTDAILSYVYDGVYMIDYAGVTISPQPCSPNNKATCSNKFKQIPLGNHPFTINFQNKTFVGNLLVDAIGYHFTWNDTSVVDIQPRNVN